LPQPKHILAFIRAHVSKVGGKMNLFKYILITFTALFAVTTQSDVTQRFYLKVEAKDSFQRTLIANTGAAIEGVDSDYVTVIANREELMLIRKLNFKTTLLETQYSLFNFPIKDDPYHNYHEVLSNLEQIALSNPHLVRLESIGKSVEGLDLWMLRITEDVESNIDTRASALFLGGHHAREHLSVEVPLQLANWLVDQYAQGNLRVKQLLSQREVHIIPMVNPDGLEYDIKTGSYQLWRKNRAPNANGTVGVDLNRNYSYQWGTGGASSNPSSETFKGPHPFSEPETTAIKNYIEKHSLIKILLSFHTFSELILYPWGHTDQPINDNTDYQTHVKMAQHMAKWNKYKATSASDLYIASGDLTDWSYGTHKIISFTFELDPKAGNFWGGASSGFYPGPSLIDPVFKKNLEPSLFLIEYADNPQRFLSVHE